MTYETIKLELADGLATITLDQATLGNPINEGFCREWGDLAIELSEIADLRAILLKANGRFFSVGGDIEMFARNLDVLPRKIKQWTAGLHSGIARLARLDAPLVAAVHGTTMGGAVGLVAGCDLVYASSSASFGAAYTKIGYSVDAGTSTALVSRMGFARARRFILCGEMLTAAEAASAGLVDFVMDDGEMLAAAEKAAMRLAQGPTRAYGDIRRLLKSALVQPLESQLEDEAQSIARMGGTADAREGIQSFVEKRKPVFIGK